jgi:hypothetical protein
VKHIKKIIENDKKTLNKIFKNFTVQNKHAEGQTARKQVYIAKKHRKTKKEAQAQR